VTSVIAISSWAATALLVALLLRARRRLVLVARASHELRGPLSAAQLGLSLLSAEPARVAAIDLELRRAGRALDDLAAARTGSAGRGGIEVVDLAELVAAHEPTWHALASAHGAVLHVESAPATVLADPLRIAQACANLVGNAAEHGGGSVRVRVRAAGELARIEVADDGPGLPASVSALTASARGRRGRRGHGLAIAAAIAEHHGGRLAAAPSDAGARLMLEMPAAHPRVVA
jgi:signal transduction histidine kinase